jgi:hypothetical protein
MEWLLLLAEGWSATFSVTGECRGLGSKGEVERSESRKRGSLFDFCGEEAESGRLDPLAANRCFRRPPGIALRAVPFVDDDVERILRVHGCCHDIPASAGISPFGARSSDRQFTSDAVCPFAL